MRGFLTWLEGHPWYGVAAVASVVLAVSVAVVLALFIRARTAVRLARIAAGEDEKAPRWGWSFSSGSAMATLGALVATSVGLSTNWRFAGDKLSITDPHERTMLFAVAEISLMACALMARQSLRDTGSTGTAGRLVWAITALASVSAVAESHSLAEAVFRIGFGPVGAAVLWHLAMGIELRHGRGSQASNNLLSMLARESRERLLARLGMAAGERAADQIARDRAFDRAVALSVRLRLLPEDSWRAKRVNRRQQEALRVAGVARDPRLHDLLRAELAVAQHGNTLARTALPSPWEADTLNPATSAASPVAVGAPTPPVSGAPVGPVPARQAVTSGRPAATRVATAGAVGSVVGAGAGVVGSGKALPATRTVTSRVSAPVGPTAPQPATNGATALAVTSQPAGTDPRLQQILQWLQAEPALSGAEAGRRLGVPERTGQRLMRRAGAADRHLRAVQGPPAVSARP
ncbi:hypothetical protein [Kitasatospora sp. NPDC059160]|uniref:hypothetical protein n=1 Tax=Kitasatospora sp. NPDC059160 TaxID=3346748 RepID=UPI003683D01F